MASRLSNCFRLTRLAGFVTASCFVQSVSKSDSEPRFHGLENWSKYHFSTPSSILRPQNNSDLLHVLQTCHSSREPVTCVGSSISPNGCALTNGKTISLVDMNRVLEVNRDEMFVTCQAGITVGELLMELEEHGLTLPNLASINQQQIGGLVQVGAHGTGASIPPLDDAIISMRLATPALGMVTTNQYENPELFAYAKCGLGLFGIVSEVTLKCVKRYRLEENVTVLRRHEIEIGHKDRLDSYDHVKYLWIPYTDSVVVVTSKKVEERAEIELEEPRNDDALKAFKLLLQSRSSTYLPTNFADARGASLEGYETSLDQVKKVNRAEEAFWKASQGSHRDWSENILSFDCGGRQLVWEVAFECEESCSDIKFMQKLMHRIELEGIPAPSPIEQRWTKCSSSQLSPAYSTNQSSIFSWVGIIFYLPSREKGLTQEHQQLFKHYVEELHKTASSQDIDLRVHWAKLDKHLATDSTINSILESLQSRLSITELKKAKALTDPYFLLSPFWKKSLGL